LNADADQLSRLQKLENGPNGFQKVFPESIIPFFTDQLAPKYVETVFMSADTVTDFDIIDNIFDSRD